jgi:hypothetical protein
MQPQSVSSQLRCNEEHFRYYLGDGYLFPPSPIYFVYETLLSLSLFINSAFIIYISYATSDTLHQNCTMSI